MSSKPELPNISLSMNHGNKPLEVAKQTLAPSLTSLSAIPSGYIAEIIIHLRLNKNDTLFHVYPHQGYGYGTIKCLEKGCEDIMITLGPRSSDEGGLSEGLGSLHEYRVHVNEHPTHKVSRYRRVMAQANGKLGDGISTAYSSRLAGNILTSFDGSVTHGTSFLKRAHAIKAEPSCFSSSGSSPTTPMKRSFSDDDTDITIPSSSPQKSPMVFKKPKLESRLAQPLAAIDCNSSISGVAGNASSSSPSLTSQAARSLLEQTNASIVTVRSLLVYFQKKSRTSAYERQRTVELEKQLRDHLATRSRYELALHSTAGNGLGFEVEEFPKEMSPFNLGAFPTVTGEIPNYGDTVDYYSDDGTRAVKQGNPFALQCPIAAPGDFDAFLLEAENSFDGNQSVDKALAKLGLKRLSEHLPSMSISLMPHQIIGVAWMLEHERGAHKGGILADEMGLGKTVQMISTMVKNRSDDPAVKSTLICVPVALLDQWKLEIETKTNSSLSCLIYHGHNKPKLLKDLKKYDVVLTTFQTLALEWPDQNAAEKKKKQRKKQKDQYSDFVVSDSEEMAKAPKKGLLLRMKWFRVVLDEAQNIRNRNTRISNAVTFVDAVYRWCLTGTPVTNSLTDCYAFMRFLKIRPWYDWDSFNAHISRLEKTRPDLASSRLQAILNSCLIRRKKDSVLDGKKLTDLPPKDVTLRKLTFSQDERDIYNLIETQTQAIINKYLRAGTILKNYSHVFVLLLRLRQLCSHPCLIQEGGDAFLLPDEVTTTKHEVQIELDRATILAGDQFVTDMKAKFRTTACELMAAEKASAETAIEEECPICFDTFTDPVVTRCSHVFCAECIDSVLKQLPVGDGNKAPYMMSERHCPTCREPIQKEMIFQRKAFEPTEEDLDETCPGSPIVVDDNDEDGQPIATEVMPATTKKFPGKGKPKAKMRFSKRMWKSDDDYDDSEDTFSDFIVESDEDEEEKDARRELKKLAKNKRIVLDSDEDSQLDDELGLLPPKVVRKKKGKTLQRFLPSTKMKEMMALLKEWAEAEETKNEKTIVLSQWTSCLDLVADYLEENGFTFVRYQGNMTRLARDDAVRKFMCQGKARIMLMSLKCGGVGLNLTRANRVISLDLGWSPAVENQAFDRVHRLGQVRSVTVQRLVIEDTVETRILALHERKQNLADGSLGEGTRKKLGRLTVKDLANLFGLNA